MGFDRVMASSRAEDHTDIDQFMPSFLAEHDPDIDSSFPHYSVATICRTWFRIEHRRSCAVNLPAVDQLVAKLFPRLRKVTWHSTLDGTHSIHYQKASASKRRNCPAFGVINKAMRFFWQEDKFNAGSLGWTNKDGLFNAQYPAINDHLQFFTKYG